MANDRFDDSGKDTPNGDRRGLLRRGLLVASGSLLTAAALSAGLAALALAQMGPTPPRAAGESKGKPNVVIMLADNVGYGDIGAYGAGEVRGMPTPRIDQLASEGLRLTQY